MAVSIIEDIKSVSDFLQTVNLRYLLVEAENEVKGGHTRPARDFLEEFKQSAKMEYQNKKGL